MARASLLVALWLLAALCSALRLAPAAFAPHAAVVASRSPRQPASRTCTPLLKEEEGDVDVAGNVGKSMMAGEKTASMLQKVKDAGVAGAISYAAWELAFWGISVPVAAFGFYEVAGHWPDLSSSDDLTKLGTEAFAFVNVARFAVPLRIGLALSTTPWVQTNVVDKFINKKSE